VPPAAALPAPCHSRAIPVPVGRVTYGPLRSERVGANKGSTCTFTASERPDQGAEWDA